MERNIIACSCFQDGHRTYKVGQKLIKIKKKAVDKMIEWNLPPTNERISHDKRIVRALMYFCVNETEFANKKIEESVIEFIKGCY